MEPKLTGSARWLLIRMPVSHQSLQAVALDPDFSKKRAKMYVTGGDKVVTTVWASTQNSRKSWTCMIGTFYLTTLFTVSPRRSEILQIDGDGFKILLRQASGHKKKPFWIFSNHSEFNNILLVYHNAFSCNVLSLYCHCPVTTEK